MVVVGLSNVIIINCQCMEHGSVNYHLATQNPVMSLCTCLCTTQKHQSLSNQSDLWSESQNSTNQKHVLGSAYVYKTFMKKVVATDPQGLLNNICQLI